MRRIITPTILVLVLILVGILASFAFNRRSKPVTPSESAASATPTISVNPRAGWKTYGSEDLGFSFQYPPSWGEATINYGNGSTGRSFVGSFSENEMITFGGITTDYVRPTGATFLDHSGCVPNGDAFVCRFAAGEGKARTIRPNKVLTTGGGTLALILFDQSISQILSATSRGAYVNSTGAVFPAIAFKYDEIPKEAISDFDQVVASVK